MKNYKLRYLPLFANDLNDAVSYITDVLNNPQAAENLIHETEKTILERAQCPVGFEPYRSTKQRKDIYYRIYVGNYTVFYVVIGNVMEVRRFIYSARDFDRLL